jgi:O-antigen/teichoic acid export membrane protein
MSSINKNFFYNILLSVTQVLFSLIVFSYVARVIEPVGIGKVSFVESICRYTILIAALGIPIYGIREVSKLKDDNDKLSQLCSELITIHFISSFFISLLYLIIVSTTSQLSQNLNFYLIGLIMIFSNVFSIEWYFQGIGDFKFITIRTLIVRMVTTILVFFMVTKPEHSFNFFLLTVLTNISISTINLFHANKQIKIKFTLEYKNLKRHSIPLLLIFSTSVSISIYVLLDTIMLGFLSDEKSVGLYSMALKISKMPLLFVSALGVVLIPQLSSSFNNNDIDRFKLLITKSIKFVITFSFPIIFYILGVSNELILVFAGESFLGASLSLKILSSLVLLIGLSNIFGLQVLTPMGKDKYLTYSVLFGTVFSISLNFFLIPLYQELGAVITNVITEVIVTIMTFYYASKFLKIELNYTFIFKTFLLSTPFYFISTLITQFTINNITILIVTSVFALFYFLIMQVYLLKNEIIIDMKNNLILKLWPNTII